MIHNTARRNAVMLFFLIPLIIFVIRYEREWLYILPAAIMHEAGHYLTARMCRVKVTGLRFGILGARMEMGGLLSYGKEFGIAMGGPAANLLCAYGMHLMIRHSILPPSYACASFIQASVGLGLLNLLPVGTMDGGRILTSTVSYLFTPAIARGLLKGTTVLCLTALWLLAAYALLRGAPTVSLFVFSFTLILRYASPDGEAREV